MSYPGSIVYDEKSWYLRGVDLVTDALAGSQERQDWRLFVLIEEHKPSGYFLLVADDEHGVTHELQTLLVDYAVFSYDALERLTQRASKYAAAYENDYLLAELPPEDKRLQLWFYRCGFRPEQQRVVRRIPRGYQGLSSPAYPIRQARDEDRAFILKVHAAYSKAYLPAGRPIDLATVELHYQLLYAAMDFESGHNFVLEEASSGRPAGYFFIRENPDKSYYVYDVAIAPEFAGRGLSRYMVGHAESLAGREGGLLYGDGSLGSPALASWHAQVGYAVDSVRFALHVKRM